MYIVVVIMLGIVLSIGTVSLWHQTASLYEASVYCYQKERRVKFAQGVLAYGYERYCHDEQLRKNVAQFQKQELQYDPPYNLPGARTVITYELLHKKELVVTVTVTVNAVQEILRYSRAVQ